MRDLMAFGSKNRAHRMWWGVAVVLAASTISLHRPLGAQRTQVWEEDVLPILEAKCLQCHGESLQMSNLDLRTREGMLKGGDKGAAIVPGNAEESPLYGRVAGLLEPKMPMAPLPPLTAEEVVVLKDWINQGASSDIATGATQDQQKDTQQEASSDYSPNYKERIITEQDRNWWAFRKPVRHALPKVGDARWSKNPIDHFVRATLENKGLTPAPQADRATLIRRAYLDLIGLLPSPTEVDEFVKDPSPNAYENLIERLLSSRHYGERWARIWLDVVRYADSSGYEMDFSIDNAWRYRDYVIKAFNEDKPYSQFLIEQLAGDELDEPTSDSLIATTYYRIGPRVRWRENDNPFYRYEYLDDIIRTTFQGFNGLSVHCARCHDHKFDPITRADYYRSTAMFFGYINYDYPLVSQEQAGEYQRIVDKVAEQTKPLFAEIGAIEKPYRDKQYEDALKKFPEEIQIAVRTPEEQRTPGQKLLAAQVTYNQENANMGNNRARRLLPVSEEDHEKRQKLLDKIAELEKRIPPAPPLADGIRDGDYRLRPNGPGDEPFPGKGQRPEYGVECCYIPQPDQEYEVPEVHFGANGQDFAEDMKGGVVAPGFLKVLVNGQQPPVETPPQRSDYATSGRRRALAEWMVSSENPLTARVMVNRIWYGHFGRGIVPTPGNFGKMGIAPTHPELLDWLATEFVNRGWSIKQIHRLVMNSETYKMDSAFFSETNGEKDPTNTWLWRYPMRRLEAEVMRDAILSASGQINLEFGGKPFFPAVAESVMGQGYKGTWEATSEEPATWRRSIYAYSKRSLKYPMFEVHDQPDPNVTAEKRLVSTVPTQALTLLNNEFILMQARYLAERARQEAGDDVTAQIKMLYRITLSREPDQEELETSRALLGEHHEYHLAQVSGSGDVAQESGAGFEQRAEIRALTDMAHVMLNSNEFVYIN